MYHVYILESESRAGETYVGFTSNLDRRLKEHESASVGYTSRFRPWRLAVTVSFKSENDAQQFETYLKTGSGPRLSQTPLCQESECLAALCSERRARLNPAPLFVASSHEGQPPGTRHLARGTWHVARPPGNAYLPAGVIRSSMRPALEEYGRRLCLIDQVLHNKWPKLR
jgi:putative endonuclease